jgi:hypothetical protein
MFSKTFFIIIIQQKAATLILRIKSGFLFAIQVPTARTARKGSTVSKTAIPWWFYHQQRRGFSIHPPVCTCNQGEVVKNPSNKTVEKNQGFGSGSVSGSGSAWIRINLSCWIRIRIQIADPDLDPRGPKWPTKIEKSLEFSCF